MSGLLGKHAVFHIVILQRLTQCALCIRSHHMTTYMLYFAQTNFEPFGIPYCRLHTCLSFCRLRRSKLKVKFVTNTTKESVRSLLARLKRIGFDVSSGDIYSSLSAAKQLIHKQHLRPHLMLHPDAMPDFDDINTTHPNAVLVGLAPVSFNYNSMNEAFR